MSEVLSHPHLKTTGFYFACDFGGRELGRIQGSLSLIHMASAGTGRTGGSLPHGFAMHMSPYSWTSLSLSSHGTLSSALYTWLALLTAQSSQGSPTPYMVTGFQVAGSRSDQPVKSYPWDWRSVTSTVSCWSKPSQCLLELKRVEEKTPSLNGKVAHYKVAHRWEILLRSSLGNRLYHRN